MNDEQISALADGALPAAETAAAVDELLAEPRARATWRRYHLIGDALRDGAREGALDFGQAPRRDNVVAFPTPAAPPVEVAPPRRRLPAAVGLAAAAAVVAVAFSLSALAPRSDTAPEPAEVAVNTPPPVTLAPVVPVAAGPEVVVVDGDGNEVRGVSQNTMVQSDEAQRRMNDYLANFNERRARQPMPGVHPYVRIVGYETR